MKNILLTLSSVALGTPVLAGSVAIDDYTPSIRKAVIQQAEPKPHTRIATTPGSTKPVPAPRQKPVPVLPTPEKNTLIPDPVVRPVPVPVTPVIKREPPSPPPKPEVTTPMMTFTLEDVLFDFNKYALKPAANPIIDQIARAMKANPNTVALIEAHTDNVGSHGYNKTLSRKRANSVRAALIRRGIAPSRLRTKAYGETRPRATNATAAGRAQNRRAVVMIK